jgi:cell division protein FtsL
LKKEIIVRLLSLFVLLLLYGISFSQYLVVSNKRSQALSNNTELKDTLSELKIQYERLTDLKLVQERAINELSMRYANDDEKIIVRFKDEE